jgi:hypothetical protein
VNENEDPSLKKALERAAEEMDEDQPDTDESLRSWLLSAFQSGPADLEAALDAVDRMEARLKVLEKDGVLGYTEDEDGKIPITIKLKARDLYIDVKEALVAEMRHEARMMLEGGVKSAIVGEIKKEAMEKAREIVRTLTLNDGRTFEQFVKDRIANRRMPGELWRHGDRMSLESLIDEQVRHLTRDWWREMVEPHLPEIKERIQKDFVSRLFVETTKPEGS